MHLSLTTISFCSILKLFVTKAEIFDRFKFNYFETYGAVIEYNAVFSVFSFSLTLKLLIFKTFKPIANFQE